ncbi:MAG: hypothetical protein KDC37_06965 [Flavobacteriales bacterium]|nr:hypothetical protein [Flavobacteriales bacterium]
MNIKVGDKVRVTDGTEEGRVIEIRSNGILMVDIYGIEIPYAPHQLVVIAPDEEQLLLKTKPVSKDKQKPTTKPPDISKTNIAQVQWNTVIGKRSRSGVATFDLHMEALPQGGQFRQPGEMIDYQKQYAIQCIEEALRRRETSIIFIHGIGKGVLKGEILKICRDYNLKVEDASLREYGTGALEVLLRN